MKYILYYSVKFNHTKLTLILYAPNLLRLSLFSPKKYSKYAKGSPKN